MNPTRKCAFCDADIPEEHEVFGFGAKARPEVDLECCRGTAIGG